MVKIAACLITKGDSELKELKRSVASVAPYVESVHITANSSQTTETEKWCKEMGFDYSYLPWNKNFSEQRIFNQSRIPKDTDFIYWQDSDDVLIGGKKLQEIAQLSKNKEYDCVYLDYWYSCLYNGEPSYENLEKVEIRHMRERLIRPGSMTWKKRIHETPVELEGLKIKQSSFKSEECFVLHLGSHRYESKAVIDARMSRNREMLELELEDERKLGKPDPRTIVYLMKIYAETPDIDVLEKNILLGKEYLELSGWDLERCTCLILMGRSAEFLGRLTEARDYFYEAIKEYPFSNNAHIRLAHCLCLMKKYEEAQHYANYVLNNNGRDSNDGIESILENELLLTEVLVKLHWEWDRGRNIRKAFQLSEKLAELNPHERNVEFAEQLRQLANLDVACEHTHKLIQYLEKQGEEKAVLDVLRSLPSGITQQPFAINAFKRLSEPKIWGKKEIAYFCGAGLEYWDGNSLKTGIGGSETAVIELSKEWVKNGWKVTVFGNPETAKVIDGVLYVPHYYMNPRDKFNIFIEWRNTGLADKISAKKYFVDFHDVVHPEMVNDKLDQIDAIMVKSKSHRNLLIGVPDEKIRIISNGVS